MEILKAYELALGQMINLDKSSIIFSQNTREDDKSNGNEYLEHSPDIGER